jgi:eukaryotic-like serine/threonine-protein kinase
VAIKILPKEFAEDAERMNRFVREAKTASALNHPNIITIHEISTEDDTHFIATEYIEGETLRSHLSNQSASLTATLEIAIQIASALDAAHHAGIIHRDIKPENVMIRPDGLVKILDFGIAKLSEPPVSNVDKEAATAINSGTSPGMIIGTANYMSPEQAQGKKVDGRSDIFSFGIVLYEMLTGRRAFEGETALESISSILKDEPQPISQILPEVPGEIERIVNQTLRKDRNERYQTAEDLLKDLKNAKQDLEFQDKLERSIVPNLEENKTQILQVTTTDESQNKTTSSTIVGKSANRKWLFAVGSIILLALSGFGIFRFLYPGKATDVATFEKIKNTKMTKSGTVISSAISPDAKYFAHVSSRDGLQSLFVRQTSANNDITVVPAAKVEYWGITFSKDSENLFYAVRDAGGIAILYRIPALGGTPQKIIEGVDCPVTFSPDGKQMAFVRGEFPNKDESVLIIANADGTGEKVLATRKEPEKFYPNYFTGPSWSPDGKMIAASVVGIGTNLHSKIIGYNVSDGKEIEITKQEWKYIGRVEWLADGKGLVMIAREASGIYRQLWCVSYPNSQARQITNEFKDYRSLSLNADSSKVVTVQTDRMIGVWVAPASDLKQSRQILPPISDGLLADWTSDGKILYFNDVTGGGNIGEMGLTERDSGNSRQTEATAIRSARPMEAESFLNQMRPKR